MSQEAPSEEADKRLELGGNSKYTKPTHPFDSYTQDNLILGPPAPYQHVEDKELQESVAAPKTEPIELPLESEEEAGSEDEEKKKYEFRRHWREPLFRLLPFSKYCIRFYRWLYGFGFTLAAVGISYGIVIKQADPILLGIVLLILGNVYPIIREVYRWRKRIVLLEHTDQGLKISYGEPDNVWLGFNGDGDGNSTTLEGSSEFNTKITWLNKLVFWGCGDLVIAGKVEAGGPPLLHNVPKIKKVKEFLSKGGK